MSNPQNNNFRLLTKFIYNELPPPPPVNRIFTVKLHLLFSFLLILLPLFLFSQPPEPDDFDWRESFVQTTKTEFNYDPNLLSQLSEKAMFYVTIRPREEEKEVTKITQNGVNIYEKYKTNFYKVGGDYFNYGLAVMINTDGESHYSLMSNLNAFQENENTSLVNFNYEVGSLEESSIDPSEFKANLEDSELPRYTSGGEVYFRNLEAGIDISFPNARSINVTNLETGSRKFETYVEVGDGILRINKAVEYVPLVSVEGYCYEKKITTTYDNYEITTNVDSEYSVDFQDAQELIVNQVDEGILKFLDTDYEGSNIRIFDILGRPMANGKIKNQSFYFKPSVAGTYIIVVETKESQFSKKIFLN